MLTPVTTPVAEATLPTALLLLVQVPPVAASLSVVVLPKHTRGLPVIKFEKETRNPSQVPPPYAV